MRRLAYALVATFLSVSSASWAQTAPSNYPLATLPLNGQDAVLLDQGSGCSTHTQPCVTKQAPSTRVGQPLVQVTAPLNPFTFQVWWNTSVNPAQYSVFNGTAWVPVYQVDTTTGIPSFPGNVYLPSGNLSVGATSVAPNWPVTLFENNTAGTTQGVTANTYENGTGTVGDAFRGFAARGTLAAPSTVQQNDLLTALHGSGYWSGKVNDYYISGDQRAAIQMQAAENWSSVNNNGTFISFWTTPTSSGTIAEIARLDANGLLGIGTTAPNFGVTLSRNNPVPNGGITQGVTINTYENSTGLVGSGFRGFAARGSSSVPTNVVTNDNLASFVGSGFWTGKTNAFWSSIDGRGGLGIYAAENWVGPNNNGTYLTLSTTNSGTGAQVERVRVQASGGVSLGTTTDPGINNLMVAGNLSVGSSTALTLAAGEMGLAKIAASGSAPGAGSVKIAAVAGTNAGTCKLIAYAGTSTTPVTVLDNIGGGC